ncbi:DUF2345 domain-containing protein, partial [Paraburkholderia hiiakae]|uniref:DUF2345 domain-containing protein n=1 Tax=Paraburkholderia hiiakae TaxID=1081782 RepID=UPI001F333BD5
LTAAKDVNVGSVNGKVNLAAAKEIILECGGAFVHIKDGSITLGGPGDLFLKTITVQKKGKESKHTLLPALPGSPNRFDDRFRLLDAVTGTPLQNIEYAIVRADGTVEHRVTDNDGHTHLLSQTAQSENIRIYI